MKTKNKLMQFVVINIITNKVMTLFIYLYIKYLFFILQRKYIYNSVTRIL